MATLSELPTEIIEQILEPVDTTDLVSNVTCVNREFNSLAWREYLRRRDIGESKSIVIDNVDAHLTLHALHMADWIKNIPTLTIRLHLSHTFFRKIHSLARFVRGLDSLGALNFHITKIEDGFPNVSTLSANQKLKSSNLFYECFRALLNAAFSKGLEELHTYEPEVGMLSDHIYMKDTSVAQARWSLRHGIKKKWLKLLSHFRSAEWYTKRRAEYPTICLCPPCSRKECGKDRIKNVRLSPMLSSPLLEWDAFSMLGAHAQTIHTLNLDETDVHWGIVFQGVKLKARPARWGRFLPQLQFPLLERFSFTGAPEYLPLITPTSIDDLLSFLDRHPTIAHLEITPKPTGWDEDFTQKAPPLSNLRTLIARNDVAAHILQRPGNCELLELVHLWSPPTRLHLDFKGAGPALAAIASNVSHPIKIELSLSANCIYWLDDKETPRKLTQIHDVRILLPGAMETTNWYLVRRYLPGWLGSFPALEQLRIDGDDTHGTALCPAILSSCPRLRSLMINEVVFHSRIE